MNIHTLESNLQEFYVAGHTKNAKLVADLSGSRIYSADSGWGVLLTWFYNISKFLGMKDLKKHSFEHAMKHTHILFKSHFSEVVDASIAYQDYLQKKFLGQTVSESSISSNRQIIARWNRTVKPFIMFSKKRCPATIKNTLATGFINEICSVYKDPLSEGKFFDQINRHRNIIKLEGLIKSPLPVKVFLKVAQHATLNKAENEILTKFVKKLNNNESNLRVKHLHKALLSVFEEGAEQKIEKFNAADITTLEMALVNKNCRLFMQKDPEYIKKRDLLKSGDKVTINQKQYILKERLGIQKDDDRNIIFTTDDSSVVLNLGANPHIHSLKRSLANTLGWGIKAAEYIDIDENSGFAVVERLYEPLSSYRWTTSSHVIAEDDINFLNPILKSLQWFLSQKRTPLNFSPPYLMFDHDGYLKCSKTTLRGDFDFNSLVKFVYESSSGNSHIFSYLMQKSQLNTHSCARFYEDMLKYTLKGEKHSASDVAATHKIIDHRIVERGRELVGEVEQLVERCKYTIKSKTSDYTNLDKMVTDQVILSYQKTASAGLLPIFLEQNIVDEVMKKLAIPKA